jgi:hypothetical protein
LHPIRIDPVVAARAVREYNSDTYRGRTNLEIDRTAYQRFRTGMPRERSALVDAVRFVGEDYGGAQRRFLPHDYGEEAALIVDQLYPVLDSWQATVDMARPLAAVLPTADIFAALLAPFHGTKRWPVWASKTLHFLRPDAFPILDSRAKVALGMRNLGSSPREYSRFCAVFRTAMAENHGAIDAARAADDGNSASEIKLLDKILYQLGE